MSETNYYNILGISKTATTQEIKRAYKKKAKKIHPDKHLNETDKLKAEADIKVLNKAKTVLLDPKKRQHYDETGKDLIERNPDKEAKEILYGLFRTLLTSTDLEHKYFYMIVGKNLTKDLNKIIAAITTLENLIKENEKLAKYYYKPKFKMLQDANKQASEINKAKLENANAEKISYLAAIELSKIYEREEKEEMHPLYRQTGVPPHRKIGVIINPMA